ncbi:MAG: S46 family peptidase [Bacteroidales bacterium]|nr:S46 family peptidase [Bacteroidales bacterium]
MLRKLILPALIMIHAHTVAFAVEGMWVPLWLDSLNIKDMQEKGLRLSAGDIYNINQSSLKDAVVIFGGGCTGAIISQEGLLITNHHCGDSRIQAHSTIENNLLENGFWALNREDELPNPGLTAAFLVSIEDVTGPVLEHVSEFMDAAERDHLISTNILDIIDEITSDSHYHAEIKPFFFGNQYLLFLYEIFRDVRLVGAPPESIGNFGGNTDNWVWPRHSGDFSLFRIYADQYNSPAEYSPDNIPYRTATHLPLSLRGVKEGDFTMVIGYPGNTDEYILSEELRLIVEQCLPAKIQIRDLKMKLLENEMNTSPEARLRYSIPYYNLSNAWKKWTGVINEIAHARAIDEKIMVEQQFVQWTRLVGEEKPQYSGIMEHLSEFYDRYGPLYAAYDIGSELLNGLETLDLVNLILNGIYQLPGAAGESEKEILQQLISSIHSFYKSNPVHFDMDLLPYYLRIYYENTVADFQPGFYNQINTRFKGDYRAFVNDIYERSLITDTVRLFRLLQRSPDRIVRRIHDDPFYQLYSQFSRKFTQQVYVELDSLSFEKDRLYRIYLTGLMEMDTGKIYYPDANSTMRIAYGSVEGYEPADAVEYRYYTTLEGVFGKENPEIQDYIVPPSLKAAYAAGNYEKYAFDHQVPVCFTASNHTSGGNSGSPVLNAQGHLIGINFDRNWEGTMSDYAYNPEVCRNISLDIRYVLFILDKVANAHAILDELTIIE